MRQDQRFKCLLHHLTKQIKYHPTAKIQNTKAEVKSRHTPTKLYRCPSLLQTHGLSLSQSLNFRSSAMADNDISSPLLSSQPSDTPHLTIIVNASDSDNHSDNKRINNGNNGNHQNGRDSHSRNPFELIGSKGLEVPGPATVDPFRNETPTIDGLYEWVKIVVCLPIAAVRLVIFGVCLLVGFLATKLALEGWKDKQNPLPRWRSRIMWVTRVCARFILFSFG